VVVQLVDMVEVGEGMEGGQTMQEFLEGFGPLAPTYPEVSQGLTPYTSKLAVVAMRCGTKECPLLPSVLSKRWSL